MADYINTFVETLYVIISVIIVADVILSWLPPIKNTFLGRFVERLASPFLSPVRYLIARSPLGGPGMVLDFSPIVALLLIRFIASAIEMIVGRVLI